MVKFCLYYFDRGSGAVVDLAFFLLGVWGGARLRGILRGIKRASNKYRAYDVENGTGCGVCYSGDRGPDHLDCGQRTNRVEEKLSLW